MSLGPERTNWYLRGIRRAEQDGRIDYARKDIDNRLVVLDDHGHIHHGDGPPLLLTYTNTRPLSFIARQILDLYSNGSDVRFLELGPGAGVACATVNRLLPDAKIDTVSLTPLNPYLRFRWDDMHERIAEPSSREKCLLRFYRSCSLPFVHNQYIGRFPSEIELPKENYHFIYENYGAIFYNFLPNGNGAPVELAPTSISAALSLLRRDGTMLIMASDGSYRMEDALESMTSDTDVIVTCKRTATYRNFPSIVARQESPLSARLREHKKGLLAASERILRLEPQALDQVIAKICALSSPADNRHGRSRPTSRRESASR
jgi:hypothetical protein